MTRVANKQNMCQPLWVASGRPGRGQATQQQKEQGMENRQANQEKRTGQGAESKEAEWVGSQGRELKAEQPVRLRKQYVNGTQ